MADISIQMPGKDKPGFFRRQREVAKFQEDMRERPAPSVIDGFIDWLLKTATRVDVPKGVDPRDVILDLSQNDFEALMTAAGGGESAVDPQNGG